MIGDGTARIRFAKGAIAAITFEVDINLGTANSPGWRLRKCSMFERTTALSPHGSSAVLANRQRRTANYEQNEAAGLGNRNNVKV